MTSLQQASSGAFQALDPITVEVIGAALSSIVEETGEALIRASYSTNIKERRDCSTALFNAAGETLCQAEHIPIHLGSFIGIVPQIMSLHPIDEMRPGDVFIGNDAYVGGDIVAITSRENGTVLALHADNTQSVRRGQLLVEIDPITAKVAMDAAEADLARTVRNVRD